VIAQVPIAFFAGLLSIVTPCVLPLVPGYLSAVSAIEADRLGQPGVTRRVALSSVPFICGFTLVFVALGAGAAAVGGLLSPDRQAELAGIFLVVLGLTFVGLLPWPERMVAPGLLTRARRQGSGVLLGAAFAVCAGVCIGPVLASILVLASDASSVLRGSVLLAAYAGGLAFAFLLAGIAFARAMSAFRWLRDRFSLIRAGGGVVLIALGLLLFFHRDWWLRVGANRVLEALGLGEI
jgi:cytochrome c-type biogenesis protein